MGDELKLKLVIDGSADGALRATRSVEVATASLGKSLADLQRKMSGMIAAATGIAGVTVGVSGIADLRRLSDEYLAVTARVKLASTSTDDFRSAQDGVFATALRNAQALEATGTLYARIAQSIRGMGKTSDDALRVVDAVAASLKISGATSAESSAALLQFSQAMAKGVLNGDELNSVLEASPRLAKALADGLRVPTGALKQMGEAGTLTSQMVAKALLEQDEQLRKEADSMQLTVGQALTNVRSAFLKLFGDASSNTSAGLAKNINVLAENMDRLAQAATLAGVAVGSVVGVRTLTALGAFVVAKQAAIAAERSAAVNALQAAAANEVAARAEAARTLVTTGLAAAQIELAAAQKAASIAAAGVMARVGTGALAAVGGPIGAIALALGVGVTAWEMWGNKGAEAVEKPKAGLAELTKEIKEFGDRMSATEADKKYRELAAAIAAARDEEKKLVAAARERANSDINIATADQAAQAAQEDKAVVAKRQEREAAEKLLAERVLDIEKRIQAEMNFIGEEAARRRKILNGEIVADEKKALETRVNDNRRAADAVRSAWEKSRDDAKKLRDEAKTIRESAADQKLSNQSRIDAVRQDGMTDDQKAAAQAAAERQAGIDAQDFRTRASFNITEALLLQQKGDNDKALKSFDQAQKYLEKAFSFAEKNKDPGMMDEISNRQQDVQASRAKITDAKAGAADQQTEALRTKMNELQDITQALSIKLEAMPVDVVIDGAVAKLKGLQSDAETLRATLAAMPVGVANQQAVATDVNRAGLGGFAYGGPLPGNAPHDRADNMLYLGTPGEWVMQRPAVRYYGPEFMAALNAMRLPKFADGGLIGRLRLPTLPAPATTVAGQAPVHLHLDGRSFPMMATPDVVAALTDHLGREALRKGAPR